VEAIRRSLLGKRAIEAWTRAEEVEEARAIDMVFLDNSMPVMGGPEACRAMRALGFRGPIFGLTGHVLEEDTRVFMAAGPIT
jgi:CheY-like chemotaxis protein